MQSATSHAHAMWERFDLSLGSVIDATCGNGHDALFLAPKCRELICIDIQDAAVEATRERLAAYSHVSYRRQSHETLPVTRYPLMLVTYNLGYLPGGDTSLTTRVESTLSSLTSSMQAIAPGGMVSIVCYPGHLEGAREEQAIDTFLRGLSPKLWCLSHTTWPNRNAAPSVFLIQRVQRK